MRGPASTPQGAGHPGASTAPGRPARIVAALVVGAVLATSLLALPEATAQALDFVQPPERPAVEAVEAVELPRRPGSEVGRAVEPTPGEPRGHGDADDHAAAGGHGFGNSRMAAAFFWIFAAITLGGGLFVITRRNLITAVMGMVGTFFGLAGLYLMLYASFLAVIQVLVYAGAIMVLFVFVVMILNRPEEEPWALQGLLGKALAGVAIAYLVFRIGGVLWDLKDTAHAVVAAPRPLDVAHATGATAAEDFGSVRAVGKSLFTDYLFAFEAVSLVLLAAVVGALAVARPHAPHEPHDDHGDAPPASA